MKKTSFFLVAAMFVAITVNGQIGTTEVAKKKDNDSGKSYYDSTVNFLGADVKLYVGQTLYLIGLSERLRSYGYNNFVKDYTKENYVKSNIYKCCEGDNKNSKYTDMAGLYFEVLGFTKDEKSSVYADKYYLQLKEKKSGDILYYKYDVKSEYSFPFIVIGYFEKQKAYYNNRYYVFKNTYLKDVKDITTGNPITFVTGEKWKFVDLTVEERFFTLSLILENSKGERITIQDESIKKNRNSQIYTLDEYNTYQEKFGTETFTTILEGKVKIGMTREMCRLAWGMPQKINETITSGIKAEQWVYKSGYLYFDNGILKTIQD